jgi:HlyD family secretion protein
MSDKRLFRQAAIDRLASPDQLDRLVTVSDRRGWLALGAFTLLSVTLLLWSVVGSLPLLQRGPGILEERDGRLLARVYIVPDQGLWVSPGMSAFVTPTGGAGTLTGAVLAVSDAPLTQASIAARLGGTDLARQLAAASPPYELVLSVPAAAGARAGVLVRAEVLTGTVRPLALLFPRLRR